MRNVIAVAVALAGTPVAMAGTTSMFFDLGATARQTAGNWNNVVPATTTLNSLIDSNGNAVGSAGFTIVQSLFDNGEPSQLGTESPSGDAAIFPVDATDDYFFGHTGPFAGDDGNELGQFRLFNLDPTKTYNFTFFSSRTGVGDIRDTAYEVRGTNVEMGVLNGSNNDSQVLNLNGITPDGGVIDIYVAAGPDNNNANGFFYINAFRVEVVPAPGAGAMGLMAGALIGIRRRR